MLKIKNTTSQVKQLVDWQLDLLLYLVLPLLTHRFSIPLKKLLKVFVKPLVTQKLHISRFWKTGCYHSIYETRMKSRQHLESRENEITSVNSWYPEIRTPKTNQRIPPELKPTNKLNPCLLWIICWLKLICDTKYYPCLLRIMHGLNTTTKTGFGTNPTVSHTYNPVKNGTPECTDIGPSCEDVALLWQLHYQIRSTTFYKIWQSLLFPEVFPQIKSSQEHQHDFTRKELHWKQLYSSYFLHHSPPALQDHLHSSPAYLHLLQIHSVWYA